MYSCFLAADEQQGLNQDEDISLYKENPEDLMRQETDGPQAEQPEFVSCGQILQDKEEEKLNTVQKRDHIFLFLEVKETFLTTYVRKTPWRSKERGCHLIASNVNLPIGLFTRLHLG